MYSFPLSEPFALGVPTFAHKSLNLPYRLPPSEVVGIGSKMSVKTRSNFQDFFPLFLAIRYWLPSCFRNFANFTQPKFIKRFRNKMSQTFHMFEMVVIKAMMPQHRFFVLAGKRTKIKCLSFQNVKISVLFKRSSVFPLTKTLTDCPKFA